MSNTEVAPPEFASAPGGTDAPVEVLTPRAVPLGGPRAMTVRRTLPQRARTLIGAWCFVDHYGPDDTAASGGMDVPPHPHTGLATVSWLFTGEVEHRDSLGTHALVRPGELNLMTGGHGIAHSEVSTPDTTVLHGVQLWVALPDHARDVPRAFAHHVPEPVTLDGATDTPATARVFLGSLAGSASPVATATPLLGAEILLAPGARLTLPVDATFEHGVLVDRGRVTLQGQPLERGELGVLPPGRTTVEVGADEDARVVLLGGPPFGEEIVMWWNFVGRSHEEIVAFRAAWEAGDERFGEVEGYVGRDGRRGAAARLPAPALPHATIRPRGNPTHER
ncbi:pirin family protein [Actinomycetospora lemnae]|uniref:Pirin family protein n=1 Tax=Actinomycetospora lemnae TaxID=3019891 RepID=A0ABT5SQT2_9PSEU|nr:pirin family protein [Actinomycetospora sp. DW7H6]MDD7965169.1 pirin family protein [Actinomycetospora sp. DW7H6]